MIHVAWYVVRETLVGYVKKRHFLDITVATEDSKTDSISNQNAENQNWF